MIHIRKSPTADSRTCDFKNVTKDQLYESSVMHITDVQAGLALLGEVLAKASRRHDYDKLTDIDGFHRDFVTGFQQTTWWDAHRKLNRHHLNMEDGIPDDVNLIDVLDYIVDCVMAGMARSGSVRPLELRPGMLERAFENTVELVKQSVCVVEEG